jgi:hypothetical protein
MQGIRPRSATPAGGWFMLGGGFSCTHSHSKRLSIGLSGMPALGSLIAPKARGGALCQSLLCFRKQPLILKQLRS